MLPFFHAGLEQLRTFTLPLSWVEYFDIGDDFCDCETFLENWLKNVHVWDANLSHAAEECFRMHLQLSVTVGCVDGVQSSLSFSVWKEIHSSLAAN